MTAVLIRLNGVGTPDVKPVTLDGQEATVQDVLAAAHAVVGARQMVSVSGHPATRNTLVADQARVTISDNPHLG